MTDGQASALASGDPGSHSSCITSPLGHVRQAGFLYKMVMMMMVSHCADCVKCLQPSQGEKGGRLELECEDLECQAEDLGLIL